VGERSFDEQTVERLRQLCADRMAEGYTEGTQVDVESIWPSEVLAILDGGPGVPSGQASADPAPKAYQCPRCDMTQGDPRAYPHRCHCGYPWPARTPGEEANP
jgi:hypothetical protein